MEEMSEHPELWERWSAIFRDREEHEEKSGPEAAEKFYETNRKAMLEGTRVLWPEREDYHALMVMREREGMRSFQSEKQNEPIDPEQCVFDERTFQYWDDEYKDVQHLIDTIGRNARFYGCP